MNNLCSIGGIRRIYSVNNEGVRRVCGVKKLESCMAESLGWYGFIERMAEMLVKKKYSNTVEGTKRRGKY